MSIILSRWRNLRQRMKKLGFTSADVLLIGVIVYIILVVAGLVGAIVLSAVVGWP